MKEIILSRYYQDDHVTLGMLHIIGVTHRPIYTLENPWKGNQTNISCIPENIYDCHPYSGAKYKDVYEVRNVPARSHILFHKGNFERNTRGCILVGLGVDPSKPEPMITHSGSAMNYLRELIGKESFNLEIRE